MPFDMGVPRLPRSGSARYLGEGPTVPAVEWLIHRARIASSIAPSTGEALRARPRRVAPAREDVAVRLPRTTHGCASHQFATRYVRLQSAPTCPVRLAGEQASGPRSRRPQGSAEARSSSRPTAHDQPRPQLLPRPRSGPNLAASRPVACVRVESRSGSRSASPEHARARDASPSAASPSAAPPIAASPPSASPFVASPLAPAPAAGPAAEADIEAAPDGATRAAAETATESVPANATEVAPASTEADATSTQAVATAGEADVAAKTEPTAAMCTGEAVAASAGPAVASEAVGQPHGFAATRAVDRPLSAYPLSPCPLSPSQRPATVDSRPFSRPVGEPLFPPFSPPRPVRAPDGQPPPPTTTPQREAAARTAAALEATARVVASQARPTVRPRRNRSHQVLRAHARSRQPRPLSAHDRAFLARRELFVLLAPPDATFGLGQAPVQQFR